MFLVNERTKIKNRIHNIITRNNLTNPGVTDIFGKYGIAWLKGLELPQEEAMLLTEHLEFLEVIKKRVSKMDRFLNRLFKEDEDVNLLKTIPGIWNVFSIIIKLEIGNIRRFSTREKFHSYAGLIPSTYSSGDRLYHGHLLKRSNKYLRWALIEAAHTAVRVSPNFKKKYIKNSRKKNKKTAIIIAARTIASMILVMLKEREVYKEKKVAC